MSGPTTETTSDALLRFLARLDQHHVPYVLASVRPRAIMAQFALPGERWEVEFLDDGTVEVERFRSDGTIADEAVLDEIWTRLDDDADEP